MDSWIRAIKGNRRWLIVDSDFNLDASNATEGLITQVFLGVAAVTFFMPHFLRTNKNHKIGKKEMAHSNDSDDACLLSLSDDGLPFESGSFAASTTLSLLAAL